jgi:hypothetical protein
MTWMDIIANATFTVVGIFCGWLISYFQSKKASADLRRQNGLLINLFCNLDPKRFSQQTDEQGNPIGVIAKSN